MRVVLLFVALTLLLTCPLSVAPASSSLSVGPDGDLFLWTLKWNTHALTHQPLAPFDANIFHPERRTLAYSENLIGSTLFAAPVLWLTGNPVLALNVVVLASCVLCGLGAFRLARQLGVTSHGALICALVFAFSPARFFRISQLHLTTVQWIPFALASAHAYLDGGRRSDLRWAVLFFTLQCLTSGHGATFAGLALLCLGSYRLVLGEPAAVVTRLKDLGLSGALLVLPVVLVFLPYHRVQQELGLRRTLENWAVTPASFLAAPTHFQSWVVSFFPEARVLERADAFLFPGFLPLLLAAAAVALRHRASAGVSAPTSRRAPAARRLAQSLTLVALTGLALGLVGALTGPLRVKVEDIVLISVRNPWRALGVGVLAVLARLALLRRVPFDPVGALRQTWDSRLHRCDRWRRSPTGFYGLLGMLCLLLAIGPPLGIWPLVYWLPGLNFIRVPSRFVILLVLCLAVLSGVGFDRLSSALAARTRRGLASVLGLLLVMEFAAVPLHTTPYEVRIPPADAWLAGRPGPFVVAEVPLPSARVSGAYERRQATYMLHSTAHWQRTVHGHSGFQPPFHDQLYAQLTNFPDEVCLRMLAETGVTYVVVHTELYGPGGWEVVRDRIDRAREWLRLEHIAGSGRVYSLRSPPEPQR
jgi:hypothetical protein